MKTPKLIPALALAVLAMPVFAQTVSQETQRDIHQQQRIENGLKSGQLSTQEAAGLERQQARIDRAEGNALKDGQLSGAERNRIQRMQNRASADIATEKHDAGTGNPNSASSLRMQADVARNVNQQKRIEGGLENGSLTRHEAGNLERGQAKDDRREARAGRDGFVGAREQRHVQRAENRQSRHIRHEKHDAQHRG